MQGFLATITTAFTPQVLFAMLGGFIGALIMNGMNSVDTVIKNVR